MSELGLSVQLRLLPLGELQSCPTSKALPWAFLCGGVATSVMIGSLVHRGRRPDSRYSTSSPDWVWAGCLMRSLEPKDHRSGRTLLKLSLGLVGDLMLILLPWVPRTNGLDSNPSGGKEKIHYHYYCNYLPTTRLAMVRACSLC